tara:strand:+ start:1796 stop:2578 length:783 start_codon:yes stop_codon:yes gene_type:complete
MTLDKTRLAVFLHLYYKIPSMYLIDKLAKFWDGDVYVSMNEDGKFNSEIKEYLEKKFSRVHIVYVENKGNDIFGFYNSFSQYDVDKEWILYLHDKHLSKLDWLDSMVDPILCDENIRKVNKIICSNGTKAGIICSEQNKQKLDNEEHLIEVDKNTHFQDKWRIVQSRATLLWLRELQYILSSHFGYIKKDDLTFDFMGGTVFFIRNNTLKLSHACVHSDYFINFYKPDGEVQHAIERFYFYVNICLDQQVLYLNYRRQDL